MSQREKMFIVVVAGLAVVGVILFAIFSLNKQAVKPELINKYQSFQPITFNNDNFTYIDGQSNIYQYNQTSKQNKLIGPVAIDLQPKLASSINMISSIQNTNPIRTVITDLNNYGGNGTIGKTYLTTPYTKWGNGNLVVLEPLKPSDPFVYGPYETSLYTGKISFYSIDSGLAKINTSSQTFTFIDIVLANKNGFITSNITADGKIQLDYYNNSFEKKNTVTVAGLYGYRQVQDILILQEKSDSNIKLLNLSGNTIETNVVTPVGLFYPVSDSLAYVAMVEKGVTKLSSYNISNESLSSITTLPDYVQSATQIIASDKNLLISGQGGIFIMASKIK